MSTIDAMHTAFLIQTSRLRLFGFKGEVYLRGGLLIIGAHDKNSASMIRRGFKRANTAGGTMVEVRGNAGAAFAWVSDELAVSRAEIRRIAA